jgi:hypothetical protein
MEIPLYTSIGAGVQTSGVHKLMGYDGLLLNACYSRLDLRCLIPCLAVDADARQQ